MGNCLGGLRKKLKALTSEAVLGGIRPVGIRLPITIDCHSSTPLSPGVPQESRKCLPVTLPTPRSEGDILSSPHLKPFTYHELKNATRNFRNLLGEGGFGCVYKGWLDQHTLGAAKPGTGTVVAAKKLKPEGFQGHKEWLSEVNYLGQLHHPNLVKLIGYCLDGDN